MQFKPNYSFKGKYASFVVVVAALLVNLFKRIYYKSNTFKCF